MSSEKVGPPPTNQSLANQEDPTQMLVDEIVSSNNMLIGIQSGVSNVEGAWAIGASSATSAGDAELNKLAGAMKGLTGSDLSKAQAGFQQAQTAISNTDQNYNNVVQGGSTAMNSLTQSQSQEIQLGAVAKEQKDSVNNLLSGWSV